MKKLAALMGISLALTLLGTVALARTDTLARPDAVARPSSPSKPDQLNRAVAWAGQDGKAKLFLVQRDYGKFVLFVAGGQGLTVTYHTRRNSSQDVAQELRPMAGSGGCLQEYRFSHTFSRTTIWMALEFAKDGKPVPELGRTFMNGIGPGLR